MHYESTGTEIEFHVSETYLILESYHQISFLRTRNLLELLRLKDTHSPSKQ